MIVLVGFMGAGKTTVGRLLARQLGLAFLDTDLVIEQHERVEVRSIFACRGEAAFRDLEEETVRRLLAGPPAVVALGGGACGRSATRELLRGHTVLYLRVGLDRALERVGGDELRPMLHQPDLQATYEGRLPLYLDVADEVVDTDGRTADAISRDALDRLDGR